MALNYGLQFPLLCDKEDDSLKTYLGNDYFDSQSFDLLSPTFAGDDFVDRLVTQLETQSDSSDSGQDFNPSENQDFGKTVGQSSLVSLCNQDDFLRMLDDLDMESDNQNPTNWRNQPDVMIVDEHDYAKGGYHRMPTSTSYSSVDDSGQSSSEEPSPPSSYERQVTSNSSCSSVAFDFFVPRAAERDESIIDVSDTEVQPSRKQRRSNLLLPNVPKTGRTDFGSGAKRKYPPLILTDEERQLCEKERIHLPKSYPLTKEEERKLRGIRRKIRNKASAQLSRKKKQEYVEALEHRITECSEENEELKEHVKSLTNMNRNLQTELRKLRAAISNTGRRTAQTGTCLAVLLLSFSLLIAPEYSPFGKRNLKNQPKSDDVAAALTPGNTRTLLQLQRGLRADDDSLRDHDMFTFSRSNRYFYDNESIEFSPPTSINKRQSILEPPVDFDGYPERDIDWGGPVAKKAKLDDFQDQTRIDLDFYKTPGISTVSNESGSVLRQSYGNGEIIGVIGM